MNKKRKKNNFLQENVCHSYIHLFTQNRSYNFFLFVCFSTLCEWVTEGFNIFFNYEVFDCFTSGSFYYSKPYFLISLRGNNHLFFNKCVVETHTKLLFFVQEMFSFLMTFSCYFWKILDIFVQIFATFWSHEQQNTRSFFNLVNMICCTLIISFTKHYYYYCYYYYYYKPYSCLKMFILHGYTWQIELLVLNNNIWNHLTVCKRMIDIKSNYQY